ncbi:gamma-glutamylcyclotransferase [Methylovirgula sp. HY1]|uniref:gamma-glutamylcyclotransferase n=1 Tax=Methylovirgula sp. HY1 TaxID=2822761 RepID=UPI00351D5233
MMHAQGRDADLWVFGYGSLMWRPGFSFAEHQIATVRGYHRALCVYSHVHRGTPDRPGLVLGLDSGGACKGMAFRVPAPMAEATIAYLRQREQVTSVYRELLLPVRLVDGRRMIALCYAVDRHHAQYAGRLDKADLERLVRQGHGVSGANPDYICNTHAHLAQLGIRDTALEWLVQRFAAEAADPEQALAG